MLNPSIDELRAKAGNRFTLAILASKRAREIIDGKPVLSDGCDPEKPVSTAAVEIAEGEIGFTEGPKEETK